MHIVVLRDFLCLINRIIFLWYDVMSPLRKRRIKKYLGIRFFLQRNKIDNYLSKKVCFTTLPRSNKQTLLLLFAITFEVLYDNNEVGDRREKIDVLVVRDSTPSLRAWWRTKLELCVVRCATTRRKEKIWPATSTWKKAASGYVWKLKVESNKSILSLTLIKNMNSLTLLHMFLVVSLIQRVHTVKNANFLSSMLVSTLA
jgi:hypothetical protein